MIIPFERHVRPAARPRSARPVQRYPLDGLLAIMVTDLAGFTARVDQLGDLAARSWIREHNALLRGALQKHAGHEVTHTGDGMITAFRSVSAALSCARSITTQLQRHARFQARIGLHAGEPLPEDGRLFGCAINTTVRVCARAAPSQIVVTEVIKQLAQGSGFHFSALGSPQLKGLTEPTSLYQLAD